MTSEKEMLETARKIEAVLDDKLMQYQSKAEINRRLTAILSAFAKQQRREGAIEKLKEIIASNRMITAKYLYEIETEQKRRGEKNDL